jgi:tRNA pseudouridine55 synthase
MEGRPLYDYARKGLEVDRAPRTVTVSRLELEGMEGDEATLSVACSKGTYVRTLAEDIGEALGCGAHLVGLLRTSIGDFRLEEAHSLEALESLPPVRRADLLQPVDLLVRGLPAVTLAEAQIQAFAQGQRVAGLSSTPGRVRVYAADGRFLGLGISDGAGEIQPRRVLVPS